MAVEVNRQEELIVVNAIGLRKEDGSILMVTSDLIEGLISGGDPARVTVIITSPTNAPGDTPFGITIDFSAAVTGFTIDDIALTVGEVADFVEVTSTQFTAVVTPTNASGTLGITIPADSYAGEAGGEGVGGSTTTIITKVEPPAVMDWTLPAFGNDVPATVTSDTFIFDCADNHGGTALIIRDIIFNAPDGSTYTITEDMIKYALSTTSAGAGYDPKYAFVPTPPTGTVSGRGWHSDSVVTNQRLAIVLNSAITVSTIDVHNSHSSGGVVNCGVRNLHVRYGTGEVTEAALVAYGDVTNSEGWIDVVVPPHAEFDGLDLTRIAPATTPNIVNYVDSVILKQVEYPDMFDGSDTPAERLVVSVEGVDTVAEIEYQNATECRLNYKVPTYRSDADTTCSCRTINDAQNAQTGVVGSLPAVGVYDQTIFHSVYTLGDNAINDSTGRYDGANNGGSPIDTDFGRGMRFNNAKYATVPWTNYASGASFSGKSITTLHKILSLVSSTQYICLIKNAGMDSLFVSSVNNKVRQEVGGRRSDYTKGATEWTTTHFPWVVDSPVEAFIDGATIPLVDALAVRSLDFTGNMNIGQGYDIGSSNDMVIETIRRYMTTPSEDWIAAEHRSLRGELAQLVENTVDMVPHSTDAPVFELVASSTYDVDVPIHRHTIPEEKLAPDMGAFPVNFTVTAAEQPELFVGDDPWKNWKVMQGQDQCYAEVIDITDTEAHLVARTTSVPTEPIDYTKEFCSDAFEGTDGDAPNPLLWDITVDTNASPVAIRGNKLGASFTTSAYEGTNAMSRWKLSGDFSVSVDVSIAHLYQVGIMLNNGNGSYMYLYTTNDDLRLIVKQDGTILSDTGWLNHSIAGKTVQLDRVGDRLSVSITGYPSVISNRLTFTDDVIVMLRMFSGDGLAVDADFDNFQVISGTIIPPTLPYPYTQELCNDTFDGNVVNETLWLPNKLPNLTTMSNGKLFLPGLPSANSQGIVARYGITGSDIDISMKFSLSRVDGSHALYIKLAKVSNLNEYVNIAIGTNFYLQYRKDGTYVHNIYKTSGILANQEVTGRLVIKDGVLYGYLNGVLQYSYNNSEVFTADSVYRLFVWSGSWSPFPEVDAWLHEFTINKGEIVSTDNSVTLPVTQVADDVDIDIYHTTEDQAGFEYNAVTCSDTFTGADGDAPNPVIWKAITESEATPFVINNNKLSADFTPSSMFCGTNVMSHWKLRGDCSISVLVDFSILGQIGISMSASDGWMYLYTQKGMTNSLRLYNNVNGAVVSDSGWVTAPIYGQTIQINRVGNKMSVSVPGYPSAISNITCVTGDITFQLRAYSAAGERMAGSFDNFQILSGTVIPPEVYPDGVKPGYIGLTGSAPAKAVWDDQYRAVYHMAQDPSVGGACVLDSTAFANHGTPMGGMVDNGGRGITFDGTTDYILCGDDPSLAFSGDFNITVFAQLGSDGVTRRLLAKGDGTTNPRNYYLFIQDNGALYLLTQATDGAATGLSGGSIMAGEDRFLAVRVKDFTRELLIDDVIVGTDEISSVYSGGGALVLGNMSSADMGWYKGTMYSVRLAATARSHEWNRAENESLRGTLCNYNKIVPRGDLSPAKLLDGDNATCWSSGYAGDGTAILSLALPPGEVVKLLKYALRGDDTPDLLRGPKDWTLEGSHDNTTWAILDTVVGADTNWTANERKEFVVSTPGYYRYYRLNITRNYGDPMYVQIGELYLYKSTVVAEIVYQDLINHTAALDSPCTITASSAYPSLIASNVMNGSLNAGEYWINDTGDVDRHLVVELDTAQLLTKYGLQMNTIPEPNRAPKDWIMYGSTDGIDWVQIASVVDQVSWSSGEKREFLVEAPGNYKHYKFHFTANNGDGNYTQLGELYLFTNQPAQ